MNSNLFGRRWKLTVSANASLTWSLINLDLIFPLTSVFFLKKSKHMSNSLTIHRTLGVPLILLLRDKKKPNSFQYHNFFFINNFPWWSWAFSKAPVSNEGNRAVGVGQLSCPAGRWWEPGSAQCHQPLRSQPGRVWLYLLSHPFGSLRRTIWRRVLTISSNAKLRNPPNPHIRSCHNFFYRKICVRDEI